MIIIDFSQIVISNLMAEIQGQKDIEVNVPLLRHMVINAIRGFKAKFGHEYGQLVLAADSRKYWRRDIFPHYKASRKKTRQDSGLDWHSIFEAIATIREELATHFPYPVIYVQGAEADDVIGTLVEWSQTHDLGSGGVFGDPEPQPILILSGDGDFEQLQRYKNVKQYSPIQKKWIVADGTPDEVIMEHILSGDKGDGIPNFLSADATFVTPGLRQKSLMKENLAMWRKQKPEQFIDKKSELMKNFKRNQQLIDLRFTPTHLKEEIVEQYILQKDRAIDRGKILNYFIANRMKQLIEHTGSF